MNNLSDKSEGAKTPLRAYSTQFSLSNRRLVSECVKQFVGTYSDIYADISRQHTMIVAIKHKNTGISAKGAGIPVLFLYAASVFP